jgi:hypothetical protein
VPSCFPDVAGPSGYPLIAAMPGNPETDAMCGLMHRSILGAADSDMLSLSQRLGC